MELKNLGILMLIRQPMSFEYYVNIVFVQKDYRVFLRGVQRHRDPQRRPRHHGRPPQPRRRGLLGLRHRRALRQN